MATREKTHDQTEAAGPWLTFAPVKKTGTDFIVQKATELGASRLMPVATANTQTGRTNTARLRAQAVEAAEQCERLSVPEVSDMTDLDTLQARELDRFAKLPFITPVTLGPRILRAETACLAALSVWQAVVGDWP